MNTAAVRPLQPVNKQFLQADLHAEQDYLRYVAPAHVLTERPARLDQLQLLAALLLQGWIIAAGSVVGVALLAALVRIAIVIVRWAL